MNDLDDAFTKGGLWPDAILSGHAHMYERFARKVNGIESSVHDAVAADTICRHRVRQAIPNNWCPPALTLHCRRISKPLGT